MGTIYTLAAQEAGTTALDDDLLILAGREVWRGRFTPHMLRVELIEALTEALDAGPLLDKNVAVAEQTARATFPLDLDARAGIMFFGLERLADATRNLQHAVERVLSDLETVPAITGDPPDVSRIINDLRPALNNSLRYALGPESIRNHPVAQRWHISHSGARALACGIREILAQVLERPTQLSNENTRTAYAEDGVRVAAWAIWQQHAHMSPEAKLQPMWASVLDSVQLGCCARQLRDLAVPHRLSSFARLPRQAARELFLDLSQELAILQHTNTPDMRRAYRASARRLANLLDIPQSLEFDEPAMIRRVALAAENVFNLLYTVRDLDEAVPGDLAQYWTQLRGVSALPVEDITRLSKPAARTKLQRLRDNYYMLLGVTGVAPAQQDVEWDAYVALCTELQVRTKTRVVKVMEGTHAYMRLLHLHIAGRDITIT